MLLLYLASSLTAVKLLTSLSATACIGPGTLCTQGLTRTLTCSVIFRLFQQLLFNSKCLAMIGCHLCAHGCALANIDMVFIGATNIPSFLSSCFRHELSLSWKFLLITAHMIGKCPCKIISTIVVVVGSTDPSCCNTDSCCCKSLLVSSRDFIVCTFHSFCCQFKSNMLLLSFCSTCLALPFGLFLFVSGGSISLSLAVPFFNGTSAQSIHLSCKPPFNNLVFSADNWFQITNASIAWLINVVYCRRRVVGKSTSPARNVNTLLQLSF